MKCTTVASATAAAPSIRTAACWSATRAIKARSKRWPACTRRRTTWRRRPRSSAACSTWRAAPRRWRWPSSWAKPSRSSATPTRRRAPSSAAWSTTSGAPSCAIACACSTRPRRSGRSCRTCWRATPSCQQKPEEAVKLLQKAAQIQSKERGDHVAAAELLERASKLKPDDREILLELCDQYSASGSWQGGGRGAATHRRQLRHQAHQGAG